jgi:hypothetical protein
MQADPGFKLETIFMFMCATPLIVRLLIIDKDTRWPSRQV